MAKIALLKKTNEKLNESLRNESPNMTHLKEENEDLKEENRELKEALDSSINELVRIIYGVLVRNKTLHFSRTRRSSKKTFNFWKRKILNFRAKSKN